MTATLPTVTATETGPVCGKCSHGFGRDRVQVRHASVTAVRLCAERTGPAVLVSAPVDRAAQAITDARQYVADHPEIMPEPVYPVCKGAECNGMTVAHRRGLVPCPVHSGPPAAPGNSTPVPADAEAAVPTPDVPAGRYAIRGTDDVVRFYVISHGKPGTRWEGRTFVDAMASDERHPVRNHATRVGILAGIAADPDAARLLAARELRRCMDCNRTLTDETSRREGRGPDCRAKL